MKSLSQCLPRQEDRMYGRHEEMEKLLGVLKSVEPDAPRCNVPK